MKIIGKHHVHFYNDVDECPHSPGIEEHWQESWVLYLWDAKQQAYVFLRMSQEPNRGNAYTTAFLSASTPGYVYKRTESSIPLVPGDRTEKSLSVGGGLCRYEYDGKHNWEVNDKDVQMRLSMTDYYPGFGPYPADSGALIADANLRHIEDVGWGTGSVTVKGKTYEVAGLAWRDHSWGNRTWGNIRAYRASYAMFGGEDNLFLTFLTFVGGDGQLAKIGALVRNDTIEITSDFDVVAYMTDDGISNCGGKVILRMDGKTHVLEFEPKCKSMVTVHQHFHFASTMGMIAMNGRTGFGVTETCNRSQGGTEKPFVHDPGILENGLYPTAANKPS